MLEVTGLVAGYGGSRVLNGLDLAMPKQGIFGLIGRNGMGKSTLLKTIMGIVAPTAGSVRLAGAEVAGMPPKEIARGGVGYVPQGRALFGVLSVRQNIRLARLGKDGGAAPSFEELASRFPILRTRADEAAGRLSGGEQQQVALARALAGSPRLLLLDEPSEGMQPSLVAELAATLRSIAGEGGPAILLVEQNIWLIRRLAARCGVLEKGTMVADYDREEIERPGKLEEHLAL